MITAYQNDILKNCCGKTVLDAYTNLTRSTISSQMLNLKIFWKQKECHLYTWNVGINHIASLKNYKYYWNVTNVYSNR